MQRKRYVGIDYLKAFFSVCVVLIHLGGYISRSSIFNQKTYFKHIFTVSDLVNFYLLLLAVPAYFIIANYLFFQKPPNKSALFLYLKPVGATTNS